MFKFNFDIEDPDTSALENLSLDEKPADRSGKPAHPAQGNLAAYRAHSVADLIEKLPEVISYTPTDIPLASGRSLTLARRDLFDARYQLIAEADVSLPHEAAAGDNSAAADPTRTPAFLDAPSDLVPGLYEGGLKTWECSLDLVDYLDGLKQAGEGTSSGEDQGSGWVGKRVLEIGCGTAIPSLYLLHGIFQDMRKPSEVPRTKITLQDYNASVLELITLPNLLIAWCTFLQKRQNQVELPISPPQGDAIPTAEPNPSVSGDIQLTPTLKAAFLSTLAERNIEVELISGSWENILRERFQGPTSEPYDLVLTSETIYRTDSLDALIGLMRATCAKGSEQVDATVSAKAGTSSSATAAAPARDLALGGKPMCLVAAKVLYFGVGGGVPDFVRAVEEGGHGRVVTVLERTKGVGRKVLRVEWS
ncbi:hypothetical protein HDZ31DRAFT_36643 [Schizophyllum fasciatum]